MGKEGRTQGCQRETVRTGRGEVLFLQPPYFSRGRDSVVSKYTDSLRIGRSRAQNSVVVRFSGHTRPAPRPLPASCTKGTGSPSREYSGQDWL